MVVEDLLSDFLHDVQAGFGPAPVPPGPLAQIAAAVIHEQVVEDEFVEDARRQGDQLSDALAVRGIGPAERTDPIARRS